MKPMIRKRKKSGMLLRVLTIQTTKSSHFPRK